MPFRRSFRVSLTVLLSLLSAGAVMAQALPSEPKERSLTFSTESSTIDFELDAVLHKVHGNATLKSGTIQWDSAARSCGGAIVIDATSLDTGNKKRDRDMHSKVLESEIYPTIEFACESFTGTVDSNGDPTGDLSARGTFSIHGEGHDVTVPMQFQRNDGTVTLTGSFEIPYVEWGMKDPSKAFLRVGKTVSISIALIAEEDPVRN